MGLHFYKAVSIGAGSQFLGTEFAAAPSKPSKQILRVKEIYLQMGSEAKDYDIAKVFTQNSTSISMSLVTASASADQEIIIKGTDADILLLPGENIQITTASATSAMEARIVYEEMDNTPARAVNDPQVTR
jgi:hypothetical protein